MYKIIGSDQKEYGPITGEQMRQWIAEGRVGAQTMVQSEADAAWRPLSSFAEFAGSFPTAPAGLAGQYVGTDTHARSASSVKGPAICMIVVAGLGIALDLLGAVANMAGLNQPQFQGSDPEVARMAAAMGGPLALIGLFLGVLVGAFIIFGAARMLKLRSYGLCIAASIVVMLPCTYPCCCLFGIPVGIWALVVLNKAEVKASFS